MAELMTSEEVKELALEGEDTQPKVNVIPGYITVVTPAVTFVTEDEGNSSYMEQGIFMIAREWGNVLVPWNAILFVQYSDEAPPEPGADPEAEGVKAPVTDLPVSEEDVAPERDDGTSE